MENKFFWKDLESCVRQLELFGCQRLTDNWLLDKKRLKIVHVCELNVNSLGLVTSFTSNDLSRKICTACKEKIPESFRMIGYLGTLDNE